LSRECWILSWRCGTAGPGISNYIPDSVQHGGVLETW
jgi:hypothetical protein